MLDYESTPQLELLVAAVAGGHHAYATLQVNLIDVNDNAPKFAQTKYVSAIWENNRPQTYVTQVISMVRQGWEKAELSGRLTLKVLYHITPHHTAPHRTAPHHTTPHATTPHHTTPHHTTPHRTAPHHTTSHHTTTQHTNCSPEPQGPCNINFFNLIYFERSESSSFILCLLVKIDI